MHTFSHTPSHTGLVPFGNIIIISTVHPCHSLSLSLAILHLFLRLFPSHNIELTTVYPHHSYYYYICTSLYISLTYFHPVFFSICHFVFIYWKFWLTNLVVKSNNFIVSIHLYFSCKYTCLTAFLLNGKPVVKKGNQFYSNKLKPSYLMVMEIILDA